MKTQRFRIFSVISQRDVIYTRMTSFHVTSSTTSFPLPQLKYIHLLTTKYNSPYFNVKMYENTDFAFFL